MNSVTGDYDTISQCSYYWGKNKIYKKLDLIAEWIHEQGCWEKDELSYDLYLKRIRKVKYKPLPKDELNILIKEAQKGNTQSLKKVVNANLRFALYISRKFQNLGLPLTDLIQEANIGLIKAIYNFDVSRGFSFSTYAMWYIKGEIMNALKNFNDGIRCSTQIINFIFKLNRYKSKYYCTYGEDPGFDQICKALNIDEGNPLSQYIEMIPHSISLDGIRNYIDNDEEFEFFIESGCNYDLIDSYLYGNDRNIDDLRHESLTIEIKRALNQLYERERKIVKMHYGLGCEEMEDEWIGSIFDLTRTRVDEIQKKAIRRLRGQRSRILKMYLG